MLVVNFNYPTSGISIHLNDKCPHFTGIKNPDRRTIRIDHQNVNKELLNLNNGLIRFASKKGLNGLWIHIDLGNISDEIKLCSSIKDILGHLYIPFSRAEIVPHCKLQNGPNDSPNEALKMQSTHTSIQMHIRNAISDKENKIAAIENVINTRISEINSRYRRGPSLYFYKRTMALRKESPSISDFLSSQYNLEIVYATLVSWDMDSRGAKLKDFEDFKASLISCLPNFVELEKAELDMNCLHTDLYVKILKNTYLKMALMATNGRIVSNSKCLHFLFPNICMPIDGTNTLQYLFGNSYESPQRYMDIIQFSFEIMRKQSGFDKYFDNLWNQSIPKMIDNAIILLNNKSVLGVSRRNIGKV